MEFIKLKHNNNYIYIQILGNNQIYQLYEFKLSNEYTKNVAKYKFIDDCYKELNKIIIGLVFIDIITFDNFDKSDLQQAKYRFKDIFECDIYLSNSNYEIYAYLLKLDNFIRLEDIAIENSGDDLIELNTRVKFPLVLGSVDLNLEDISNMEIGDVVLLDNYQETNNCQICFENYNYNFQINKNQLILK
jgi:hypothetical protein